MSAVFEGTNDWATLETESNPPKATLSVSVVCCWSSVQSPPGLGDGLTDGDRLGDADTDADGLMDGEALGEALGLAEREADGEIDGLNDVPAVA